GIETLSLHDALPIWVGKSGHFEVENLRSALLLGSSADDSNHRGVRELGSVRDIGRRKASVAGKTYLPGLLVEREPLPALGELVFADVAGRIGAQGRAVEPTLHRFPALDVGPVLSPPDWVLREGA